MTKSELKKGLGVGENSKKAKKTRVRNEDLHEEEVLAELSALLIARGIIQSPDVHEVGNVYTCLSVAHLCVKMVL